MDTLHSVQVGHYLELSNKFITVYLEVRSVSFSHVLTNDCKSLGIISKFKLDSGKNLIRWPKISPNKYSPLTDSYIIKAIHTEKPMVEDQYII